MDLDTFEDFSGLYDETVLKTPDIMRFCSSSDWILSANKWLSPAREALFIKHADTIQAWAVGELFQFNTVLQPLESDWFFGCPLASEKPEVGSKVLLETLTTQLREFPLIWLGGVPTRGKLFGLVVKDFRPYFRIYHIPGCDCHVTSLDGGWDSFYSRRSSRFRNQMGKIEKEADACGVEVERFEKDTDPVSFFRRIREIEARSWKGRRGESIFAQERFIHFYSDLIGRLAGKSAFRSLILKVRGKDFAYVMGGVLGKEYRGFQMAYHDAYKRLSPGHLCQIKLIRSLCEEGLSSYDLGMVMDYKTRWADRVHSITNLLLMRK